jgi:TetR/AcrR family transcriptional regulator, mexJK operon transcriptional repressor
MKPTRKSVRRASANPGPGRPTAARVETINRIILVEARNEFSKSGYEAARMDNIAAAAGVSKGTLYCRYPTKEALLRAVIAEQVATWSKNWQPEPDSVPADLRQRLKQRAHGLMEYLCSGKLEVLERLGAGGPFVEELRRMRSEVGHQRTVEVIARDIVDGTPDQPIQRRAALRLAEALVAMLYGWWRARQEFRRVTREEAFAYADYAVDLLFDGRSAWATLQS